MKIYNENLFILICSIKYTDVHVRFIILFV